MELVDLPADKGIVVRVGLGGEESTTPVYTRSKRVMVCLEVW